MKTITIYTDGSCFGNPGPGGWGAILKYGKHIKEIKGFEPHTTNNRMELMAVIKALETLKEKCSVQVYTDSTYVQKGLSEWIHGWHKKNYKGIKNDDLWRELYQMSQDHTVELHWVKGHAGHPENERADELARSAIEEAQLKTQAN